MAWTLTDILWCEQQVHSIVCQVHVKRSSRLFQLEYYGGCGGLRKGLLSQFYVFVFYIGN